MLSNLPPGCTDADIERAQSSGCPKCAGREARSHVVGRITDWCMDNGFDKYALMDKDDLRDLGDSAAEMVEEATRQDGGELCHECAMSLRDEDC